MSNQMRQQWTTGLATSVAGGLLVVVVTSIVTFASAYLMSNPWIVGFVSSLVAFVAATSVSTYVLTLRRRRTQFDVDTNLSKRCRGFKFRWISVVVGLLAASAMYFLGAWVSESARPDAEVEEIAPGVAFRDCENCPIIVMVPAGSFSMGSPIGEAGRYANEGPIHPVTINETFGMSVYEVTRGQFKNFVEDSGYEAGEACWTFEDGSWRKRDGRNWKDPGYVQDDQHPVVCVNRDDASEYATWLTAKTGQQYRLPTESEWEYAARAGTNSTNYWGDRLDVAHHWCQNANIADTRTDFLWRVGCDDRYEFTAPVGSYVPNPFRLHDMLGNVWEWTQDCWSDDYSNATADGSAYMSGKCDLGVLRGGSRYVSAEGIRVAHRFRFDPASRNENTGFRVVRWARPTLVTNAPRNVQLPSSRNISIQNEPNVRSMSTTDITDAPNCDILTAEIEDIADTVIRDSSIHEILSVLLKEAPESENEMQVRRVQCAARIAKLAFSTEIRDAEITRVVVANLLARKCSAARELTDELWSRSKKSRIAAKVALECLGRD